MSDMKMDNFKFWVQKVLPTVYDDSLSYYELLGKVIVALNDVIRHHNAVVDEIMEYEKTIDNRVTNFEESTTNRVEEFEKYMDIRIRKHEEFTTNRIKKHEAYTENQYSEFTAKITTEFENIKLLFTQLQDFVDHYFDGLEVQNEINNKLDKMVEEGLFENVLAEFTRKKLDDNIINVQEFGCIGDGITNDTEAFQNACDFAKENKRILYVPNKKYLLDDIYMENIQFIRCYGELSLTSNSKLYVFYNNDNFNHNNIYFNKVYGDTTTAIEMRGLSSDDITIQRCKKLRLLADETQGRNWIAYNKFYLGFVPTLEIISEHTTGWINENLFFGGRFENILIDGDYANSQNIFYDPLCEGTTININTGYGNKFIDARLEGSATNINFGERTAGNVILMNWRGTKNGYFIPTQLEFPFPINDVSGLNTVTQNEFLNEEIVFSVNKYNNPTNLAVTNDDNLTVPAAIPLYASELIEIPNVPIAIWTLCSTPLYILTIIGYDENKQLITSNSDLLIESPTLSWSDTARGYLNSVYTRKLLWGIINPKTTAKYFRVYLKGTANTGSIENIDCIMTYRNRPDNLGYIKNALKTYKAI